MKWRQLSGCKKVALVILALACCSLVYLTVAFWLWASAPLHPNVCIFQDVSSLRQKQKEHFARCLSVAIPKHARDIYLYIGKGRDRFILCSFVLPSEDVPMFGEEFLGIPVQLHKLSDPYEDTRAKRFFAEGPEIFGDKWKTSYWNIMDIYERCLYFEPEEGPGSRKFMAVDPQTNRVYIGLY